MTTAQVQTCPNCGHTGEDVHYWPRHIGGQGTVPILQCDDIPACFQRWDDNHKAKGESRDGDTQSLE